MGYYSHINGELTISPEIDESHWPYKAAAQEPQFGYFTFDVVPGEYDAKVVDGQMVVVSKPGRMQVSIFWEDSIKAYDFAESCDLLATWAKKNGSTIEGTMRIDGEEDGDISRVRFDNGKPLHETPTLTWPNGDVENP